MEVISQQEAKSQGLSRFFTGKPCKRGHICERYSADGDCVLCKKERNAKSECKECPVKKKARDRKYYHENKETILAKAKKRMPPEVKFIRKSIERLENRYYLSKTNYEEVLGYTREDFIAHIESLWEEGMSWDNRSEWHIDHIKSIKSFKDEGITDPKIVNALSNLQPLWAEDNLRKGG